MQWIHIKGKGSVCQWINYAKTKSVLAAKAVKCKAKAVSMDTQKPEPVP